MQDFRMKTSAVHTTKRTVKRRYRLRDRAIHTEPGVANNVYSFPPLSHKKEVEKEKEKEKDGRKKGRKR